MKITPTTLPDVKILEPQIFKDERGFFFESYNQKTLAEEAGIHAHFVQDNHSRSAKDVLRGLHYQLGHPQSKLVRVVSGKVFDVAVDLRQSSPTFGQWTGIELSADNHRMVWIPKGFAHGFLVLSETAELLYKTTDFYDPSTEHCLRWDDPSTAIEWPIHNAPIISTKDQQGNFLSDAELFP